MFGVPLTTIYTVAGVVISIILVVAHARGYSLPVLSSIFSALGVAQGSSASTGHSLTDALTAMVSEYQKATTTTPGASPSIATVGAVSQFKELLAKFTGDIGIGSPAVSVPAASTSTPVLSAVEQRLAVLETKVLGSPAKTA